MKFVHQTHQRKFLFNGSNKGHLQSYILDNMQNAKIKIKMDHYWKWLIIWKWHFLGKTENCSTFRSRNQHERLTQFIELPVIVMYQINFWIVWFFFSKKATLKLSLMSNDENKFLPIYFRFYTSIVMKFAAVCIVYIHTIFLHLLYCSIDFFVVVLVVYLTSVS